MNPNNQAPKEPQDIFAPLDHPAPQFQQPAQQPVQPIQPQQNVWQPQPSQMPQPILDDDSYDAPGAKNLLFLISAIVGGVLTLGLTVAAIFFITTTAPVKAKVLADAGHAVDTAVAVQNQKDQADFNAAEALPTVLYKTPSDYGEVNFPIPRAWNSYNAEDGTGTSKNTYTTYFANGIVPSTDNPAVFPMIISMDKETPESHLKTYNDLLSKKDDKNPVNLQISDYTATGKNGFSLVGKKVSGTIYKTAKSGDMLPQTGTVLIFKVREKTLTVTFNDAGAETFNNIIQPNLGWRN